MYVDRDIGYAEFCYSWDSIFTSELRYLDLPGNAIYWEMQYPISPRPTYPGMLGFPG